MRILKMFIPKDKAQSVEELESYTVEWEVKSGWGNNTKKQHKVFIKIEDAKEFKKQLSLSAEFLGCWISTELYKN